MAINLARASSQFLELVDSGFDVNSDYTAMGWWYLTPDAGLGMWYSLFEAHSPGVGNDSVGIELGGGVYRIYFDCRDTANGTGTTENKSTATTGVEPGGWAHYALVREGNSARCIVNGDTQVGSDITYTIANRGAINTLWVGKDAGGLKANCRCYSLKLYQRALTMQEIASEMRKVAPISTRGLFDYWPFEAGSRRSIGKKSGITWTENGSPTDADPPNIPWGVSRGGILVPAAAAGGAMTGSASLAVNASGTLAGAGAMTGAASISLNASGTLAGVGALSGSATTTLNATGTLTGAGALAGATAIALNASGTLAGAGSMTGAASLALNADGTIAGSGALIGAATFTLTVTGSFDTGAIVGSASLGLVLDGALIGLGALSGSAGLTLNAAGSLGDLAASVITYGTWSDGVALLPGDEWRVRLTGPSADAPRARVALRFQPC